MIWNIFSEVVNHLQQGLAHGPQHSRVDDVGRVVRGVPAFEKAVLGAGTQVDDVDASLSNLRALITRFNSDSKTTVGWDQTGGAQNRVAQHASFARSGQAILNDLSIQAGNRQTIQVSCQYQGSGALA